MTFKDDSGKHVYVIADKRDIPALVDRMDDRNFFWTKTDIL